MSFRQRCVIGTLAALPSRVSVIDSSKWMCTGWSQPPPPFLRVQISRVPGRGIAETRLKSAARLCPPSVLMVHGALSLPPDLSNSKVRWRATGIFERSGFGINVTGVDPNFVLLSGPFAGMIRNSKNLPTHGSLLFPLRASERVRSALGPLPS